MSDTSSTKYKPVEGTKVRVADNNEVLTLDYDGAFTVHKGSLWWGAAVGYRAMQVAADALSKETLWDRNNLYVVSGHPGPGVIDSLNYVTRCVDRDSIKVMENPNCVGMCNAEMKFEWWVSDKEKTVAVKLREDFVPQAFYDLTERLMEDVVSDEDKRLFELFKVTLSAKIWNGALEDNFSVEYSSSPLKVGELPDHEWNPQAA